LSTKQLRIEIFQGTQKLYQSSQRLKKAVETSCREQSIYWEGEQIEPGQPRFSEPFRLVISGQKTIEAAEKYAKAGKRVCILNFASSVSPGGGVLTGSQAQEESICRVSTLYFSLRDPDTAGRFYQKHWELIHANRMNRRNNDDIIYTPGVVVVRDDANGEKLLPEEAWYCVDAITCAAPDIRLVRDKSEYHPESKELYDAFVRRWRCILSAGAKNKQDVLILGAFGCGVFANPPGLVADAFCEAAADFKNYFETVEFAIYSPGHHNENFRAFEEHFIKNGFNL